MRFALMVTVMMLLLALPACGNTGASYRPIVDGKNADYEADLASCQEVAQERSYLNSDVATAAGVGAAVGGGVGVLAGLGEDLGDVVATGLVGAALGSAIGAGTSAYEAKDERKNIVKECMKLRGHRVVG